MGKNKDVKISKLISLVLRHKPETLRLKLDKQGWCNTYELINGLNNFKYNIDLDGLKKIVNEDNKQRYSFNEDFSKIRANQGHSLTGVNLGLEPIKPTDILYHGTSKNVIDNIFKNGIKKMNRQYVHLSDDIETAVKVGERHGIPIVLEIDAKRMYKDGEIFYRSENGVWLTSYVHKKYIKIQGI